MAINQTTTTITTSDETANVSTKIERVCSYDPTNGPQVAFRVTITAGDTHWKLDSAGNVIGLTSTIPDNQITYLLAGDEYASFAGYILTEEEAKLPFGEILATLIDRAIKLHKDNLAKKGS